MSTHAPERGARVPVLRVKGSALVAMPPSLDDPTANRLSWDIGAMIQETDLEAVILDLSATDLVDSYLARCIRNIAVMAQLMGVRAVLCGMAPMIAMTLIEMGLEIGGVATAPDLDSALALVDKERVALPTVADLLGSLEREQLQVDVSSDGTAGTLTVQSLLGATGEPRGP